LTLLAAVTETWTFCCLPVCVYIALFEMYEVDLLIWLCFCWQRCLYYRYRFKKERFLPVRPWSIGHVRFADFCISYFPQPCKRWFVLPWHQFMLLVSPGAPATVLQERPMQIASINLSLSPVTVCGHNMTILLTFMSIVRLRDVIILVGIYH